MAVQFGWMDALGLKSPFGSDTDSDPDEEDDPRMNPAHPCHGDWWEEVNRTFGEVVYKTWAIPLNPSTKTSRGRSSPSSLFLTACEAHRKKLFLDAWVLANSWCRSPNPQTKWDQALYNNAISILSWDEVKIRAELHIP